MARGALQSSGEAGVERVRRISDTPSDDPPLVRAPGAGGRRSVRVGRRFHVAHHRTRRAGRHVAPDARGIARAARAPRGRRHAAAAVRGVDARPPRGRGVGRDLRPRVLRRAIRRGSRRGCDAPCACGCRPRAGPARTSPHGIERPARGVRQRGIRGRRRRHPRLEYVQHRSTRSVKRGRKPALVPRRVAGREAHVPPRRCVA